MAIRWKEGELDDLRKEIARYNRKISRLQKKNVDLGMGSLPERGKLRTVKGMETRAELNAFKRSMERFMKPGSEALVTTKGGIVIPKYERAEINALNARINNRRRKSWSKAHEAKARGDLPLMGRIKDNEARVRKNLANVKPADYAEYKRVAINEGAYDFVARKEQMYRQNYYKMIDNLYSPRDARKIKARLSRISDHELVEKSIDEEDISFAIGSPTAGNHAGIVERMTLKFQECFPEQFKTLNLEDDYGEIDPDILMLENNEDENGYQ